MVFNEISEKIKIICPNCHADLKRLPNRGLVCMRCGCRYPARSKVDVLLTEEAWLNYQKEAALHRKNIEEYIKVRRNALLTEMYYDMWVSRLLGILTPNFRGSLLEAMAGGCEISRRLPPNVLAAAAIDKNVAFIEQANDYFISHGEKRVISLCCLIEQLPFPDEHFDAVIVQGGFHHVRPTLHQVLSEIFRVLRPDGILIASEPANDFWLIHQIRKYQYAHTSHQGYDEGEDGFTESEIINHLSDVGLKLMGYERFGLFAYMWMGNMDVWPLIRPFQWRWLGNMLLILDDLLEKVPMIREFAWASIFWAQKEYR